MHSKLHEATWRYACHVYNVYNSRSDSLRRSEYYTQASPPRPRQGAVNLDYMSGT